MSAIPKPQARSVTVIPQKHIGDEPVELTHILFTSQLSPDEQNIPTALYIPDQPTEERDLAIANFMDAWAELEHELASLLHYIMGTQHKIARAVQMNTQGMGQFLDLLMSLAPITLNEDQRARVVTLRDRVKIYATKRNRIVHGYWSLAIKFRGVHGVITLVSAEWERRYDPTDPEVAQRLGAQAQKELAAYVYNSARLTQTADEVRQISASVVELCGIISKHLYQGGMPPL